MSRKVAREVAFKIVFELAFQKDEEATKLYEKMMEASEEKYEVTEEDNMYISSVINGIQTNENIIDEQIKAHLKDWSFDRISKIDLAILRLAIYEIKFRKDIPCKVSVNEAVELAKVFGEESSHVFINGILAEILKEVEE